MTTRITFLGHGTFEILTAGKSVVIDPFFTGNPAATLAAEDVSPDYIIMSHGHGDHIGDVIAIAQRTGAQVIASHEITEWLGARGVPNTHAMNTGGSHGFEFGTVKLTIAHHSSMLPDGSNGGSPCGILLRLDDGTIYHAADTGLFYDMKLIGEEGIDLAILPIGDNFTMGPDDALRAVKLIRPKRVIPNHYNTWPLIDQDANAWAERVKSETTCEPIVLEPGQSTSLS
ncbi:MAG: metal-dependent hydrolase [Planctomycetota bacterium]|nr:metal-dependent hydrolase [Planctomycetota bacterium]